MLTEWYLERWRVQLSFLDDDPELSVRPINNKDAHHLILNVHYAGRLPSISYAFGLFRDGENVGIVTYGKPSAAPQRTGVCGKDLANYVLELNRLCLRDNLKNEASYLVAASLKLLPQPSIVISYADPQQGHVGYIYQATNFLYCGLTAKRTEWKIKGFEHLHSQTIADRYRGCDKPSESIRAEHGDDFYLKDRPRKHRYVYFTGNKRDKKRLKRELRYPTQEYPKNDQKNGP